MLKIKELHHIQALQDLVDVMLYNLKEKVSTTHQFFFMKK